MSLGGLYQRDVSPCTLIDKITFESHVSTNGPNVLSEDIPNARDCLNYTAEHIISDQG